MEMRSTSNQKGDMAVKQPYSEEQTVAGQFFSPATDIFETNEVLMVIMDMPGIKKDHLKVKVEKNTLEVEGLLDTEVYKDLEPAYAEYHIGHYMRKFGVSQAIDTSKIEAHLKDGVLRLTLPKRPEEKTRTIQIN
ncbi:MAG: Hsp20/alpha crystallin family protein [SAR324 cluster bacterium]|nr:Hsp20/alpha crystallin family protein [SAR324 cluster bacterium]